MKMARQILRGSIQRDEKNSFVQFTIIFSAILSSSFPFKLSLSAWFPCTPALSVAVYVVTKWGLWQIYQPSITLWFIGIVKDTSTIMLFSLETSIPATLFMRIALHHGFVLAASHSTIAVPIYWWHRHTTTYINRTLRMRGWLTDCFTDSESLEINIRPRRSHSNSFDDDAEKDRAGFGSQSLHDCIIVLFNDSALNCLMDYLSTLLYTR